MNSPPGRVAPNTTVLTMKRMMTACQPAARPADGSKYAGPILPLALAALLLGSISGCYDGDALVTQTRSAAISTRLAEVDLGAYHTSLPRDPKTGSVTEFSIHIFGNVPHYRVAAIERQLRIDEYRLRHETIAAVRATTNEELADPGLKSLRERIERIVNGILEEAPVETIGFYEVAVRQR